MAKDHDYKVDTKIRMTLGIGLATCTQEGSTTIGDLLDCDQERLDTMDKGEIENEIYEEVKEWAHNYIDFGWSEKEE